MLGEAARRGTAATPPLVAYCAQQAWIENKLVVENIVFGAAHHAARYMRVVDACALAQDLQSLAHGDRTLVGERGVTLSGGQKQRIALARASCALLARLPHAGMASC